jgi:hypothetical protein
MSPDVTDLEAREREQVEWEETEKAGLEPDEDHDDPDGYYSTAPTADDERWWSKVIAGEVQQGRRLG